MHSTTEADGQTDDSIMPIANHDRLQNECKF